MSTEAENRDRVREMLWAITDPRDKDAAISEVVSLIAAEVEVARAETPRFPEGVDHDHEWDGDECVICGVVVR